MSDLIDRQELLRQIDIDAGDEPGYYGDTWKFIDTIKSMPSAELGTNLAEVGTDCISRQAAIDAILAVTGNSSVRELYEHVQEHGLSDMWSGGVNAAIDIIIAVPPAHPEHDENELNFMQPHKRIPVQLVVSSDCISRQAAIDALKNRWKKTRNYEGNGDDIAEECELYLKQVPSAQLDLSGYSSRLWKAAYERGKAEAQDEIVRCKDCKFAINADTEDMMCGNPESWVVATENDFGCVLAERSTGE